jgi:hypothetical protein
LTEGSADRPVALYRYVEHLRQSVPDIVHPSGASWIHHYLGDMLLAADAGDLTTFYTLSHRIKGIIDREVRWHRENLESCRPPRTDG